MQLATGANIYKMVDLYTVEFALLLKTTPNYDERRMNCCIQNSDIISYVPI